MNAKTAIKPGNNTKLEYAVKSDVETLQTKQHNMYTAVVSSNNATFCRQFVDTMHNGQRVLSLRQMMTVTAV